MSATVIAVDYRVAPENRTAGRCPTAVPTSPGHPSRRRRSTSTHRRIDASTHRRRGYQCWRWSCGRSGADGARSNSPSVRGQMLMGPMLDDRNDTYSAHQLDRVDVWDRTKKEVDGRRCWAPHTVGRTCHRTPDRRARRTCPTCRPTSMSGRRNLPGRGGLLRRSDPAILWVSRASHLVRGAFTASTRSHRTCRYPEMLEPRDWPGCVAYSTPGPRSKWRRHPTANNGPAPAVVGSCQARRGLFLGPLRRLGRCIVVRTGGSRGRFAAAARCARSGSRAAGSMRSSVQANGSLKIAMLAGTVGPLSACGGAAAILLGQPDVEHPSRPRPPAGPRDFCNRVDGGLPGGIGQSAGARPGGPCADSMVPRWLYRSPVAVLAICPQTSRALSDVARSSRR